MCSTSESCVAWSVSLINYWKKPRLAFIRLPLENDVPAMWSMKYDWLGAGSTSNQVSSSVCSCVKQHIWKGRMTVASYCTVTMHFKRWTCISKKTPQMYTETQSSFNYRVLDLLWFVCGVHHYSASIWLLWKSIKAWMWGDLGRVGGVRWCSWGTAFDMLFTDLTHEGEWKFPYGTLESCEIETF